MTALAIVDTQVLLAIGGNSMVRNAAVAITAGDALYLDANNNWALAFAGGSVLEAAVSGIALNNAAIGQPVNAAVAGALTLGAGAAPLVGHIYAVGAVAGTIVPYEDLITGNRVSLVGWGITGNGLQVSFQTTGVAKAA